MELLQGNVRKARADMANITPSLALPESENKRPKIAAAPAPVDTTPQPVAMAAPAPAPVAAQPPAARTSFTTRAESSILQFRRGDG